MLVKQFNMEYLVPFFLHQLNQFKRYVNIPKLGFLQTEMKRFTNRCGEYSFIKAVSPGHNRDVKLVGSM